METSLEEYLETNPDGFRLANGLVQNSGKYEGEPLYVPYFDGFDPSEFFNGSAIFYLTEKEKELINTLDEVLILHYTESGFVDSETCSKRDFAEWSTRKKETKC